jgi:hypothetical protein
MIARQTIIKEELLFPRRGGRVVECARLEIGCAARYRGFESRPLRQAIALNSCDHSKS